jgi:hypothetical protein
MMIDADRLDPAAQLIHEKPRTDLSTHLYCLGLTTVINFQHNILIHEILCTGKYSRTAIEPKQSAVA